MVHQYKLNGYNIVMDTASGSVHLVDEVAYDIIEMHENHTKDEIISGILKKYAAQPDVTESEIEGRAKSAISFSEKTMFIEPEILYELRSEAIKFCDSRISSRIVFIVSFSSPLI